MVAKSEASMQMSRALSKLAVATDLGTAARPSTAVPLSCPAASTGGVGTIGDSGSGVAGGRGKAGLTSAPGRNLLIKPSAARNVLASLPLPLANLERQSKKAASVTAAAPPATTVMAAAAVPPQASSGALAAAAAGPSTPRLPPLPAHIPQPPSPQAVAVAAAVAQSGGAQLPPATPPTAQQSMSPHLQQRAPSHSHSHSHSTPLPPPPLPPCGMVQMSSGPGGGGAAGSNDISKELRDAARNHPGLPAGLLAQLHHPRRPGMPISAPFPGTSTSGSAAAAIQPPASGGAGGAGGVRPLSPRSRARLTASLVNGSATASAAAPAAPPPPPPLPAPAAMASLSPEALAVLFGSPSSQPPPPTAGGLLVMRRAGPVAVGAGAALRPSTAQHSSGSGGGRCCSPASSAAAAATAAAGAPPRTASGPPSRPPVVPHITVPYKPGSIRLPPGGVPGITAAVALGGASGKAPSGPGSAAGSGTGSPVVPSTAGAVAGKASPSELLRPWTSAGGGASGTLRPVTANPLTHCMPTDSTATLVVRVPRSATEASNPAQAAGGAPAPPSRAGDGPHSTVRMSVAAARPGAITSAPGPASERSTSAAGDGPGASSTGGTNDARQLTAQELRAVVAALAASRPEAAAILLQRPGTAVSAAGTGDMRGRPVSSPARRPATRSGGFEANTMDAAAPGELLDPVSMYGKMDRNLPPGSTSSRTSSRATTRGSLLSESAVSFSVSIRDPSVYDDKWPRPTSGGSRPSSRGTTVAAAASAMPPGAGGGGGGAGNSRGGSNDSHRQAISAWGSTKLPLQSIPEDAELAGGEEVHSAAAATTTAAAGDIPHPLHPLEPLESDPELDAAWASIVAANQRPDTAAARAPSSGLNVFSRPPTGAIRITRQAAPMVLVLEDLTASTPEVLERELETLGLEELQALRTKLCG